MTTVHMIALLMAQLGGLLIGVAAYGVATRPARQSRHHPAE